MPSASVVMVFYNEAASVVLRTVHSVLNKSPEHLIHEILLYDDNSDLGETFATLKHHETIRNYCCLVKLKLTDFPFR